MCGFMGFAGMFLSDTKKFTQLLLKIRYMYIFFLLVMGSPAILSRRMILFFPVSFICPKETQNWNRESQSPLQNKIH